MNMEYPFSSKVKARPRAQLDEISSALEDPNIKFAELMNLDAYPGWCNGSPAMDHWLVSNGLSPLQPFPLGSFDSLNLTAEQPGYLSPSVHAASNGHGISHNCADNVTCQQTDAELVYPSGSNPGNQQENFMVEASCMVSRPLGFSLDEKMLKALSFLREFSGDGILAQVWVPIRQGGQYVLSTSEQPYLLDKTLAGFREVSRTFTFSAELKPGLPLGLPGRVFVSKVPEWTSNVVYYNKEEYVRVKHAVDHEVRGSIALPILNPSGTSCCAVLELVTVKEKSDFDSEMENICHALQAVDLRSTLPPRLLPQCLSDNRRAALAEIMDVLRAVCHAHTLPLGLTWIPCHYTEDAVDEIIRVRVREGSKSRPTGKCVLCIEDTACYVNDRSMQGFVHACVEHYIEEGQGIAGKALQSNHPFFIPDVKAYDITEYPHVHHSRKYGLNAAVAIRLRSTYTGDHDYILELFLPVNTTGSQEQQLLLNSLSNTMQKVCKSLRTVSDAELAAGEGDRVGYHKETSAVFPQISISEKNSQTALSSAFLDTAGIVDCNASSSRIDRTVSGSQNCRATTGPRKQLEKKKSNVEKNVSLSVLQQYFSGSLKDAAKSIGVCPTTLKRICRHHGISRWPSRKINKVNRSLKKIQTVLDSVQGVEGGFKFDPSIGGFTAGGPTLDELDTETPFHIHHPEQLAEPASIAAVKVEDDLITTTMTPSIDCREEDSKPRRCGPHEITQLDKSSSQQRSWSDNSSSHGSESMHGGGGGCSSSSQTFEEGTRNAGGKIFTVKASYKDDTIRFKFDPSAGCFHLYEEVGKRFKLQSGTFQLKYMDDEEEWVLLTSDSDLHECCEILDYVGKESVKLVVRDVPFAAGSSGSSNCFLAGSS
ncbi:unnamed protein product [Linum trigynum]|uniref:Uncharacterized protein n=2 Tax=Linum trigynum TaxID=586398 RepID=A0AAV2D2P6_9ROSI